MKTFYFLSTCYICMLGTHALLLCVKFVQGRKIPSSKEEEVGQGFGNHLVFHLY